MNTLMFTCSEDITTRRDRCSFASFGGLSWYDIRTHTHTCTHTRTHTHTHFSRLLGIQFEGLNYVEDFLVQASTESKLIPVASWIRERRIGLEMCVGVEPNRVEILIMSRNKNVATADGTTRSIVSLLRFYSYQIDGLCNILTYVETYWLDSINRHIPDVYFHLPSQYTLLLLPVTSWA